MSNSTMLLIYCGLFLSINRSWILELNSIIIDKLAISDFSPMWVEISFCLLPSICEYLLKLAHSLHYLAESGQAPGSSASASSFWSSSAMWSLRIAEGSRLCSHAQNVSCNSTPRIAVFVCSFVFYVFYPILSTAQVHTHLKWSGVRSRRSLLTQ